MAEQQQPVRRKVALKVLKAGMDTRQVIARFEAERQALALMDHPNIARVLDAGETNAGRPYFVMELVKGVPITQFCDENQLTPRERLELLLPVCQAIQHAHQKGVIHRDIKPSNVLVAEYDQNPVPKIIDFGVAKATGQELTEKTMFTALGQIVGTLEYMSPEQAKMNQLDIDTRSDIYSLGVLLYELLTGTTPFDKQRLRSAAIDEILRMIREEEPPRPSTRLSTINTLASVAAKRKTEPARLAGLVRGELDWIVMKALEKDRNRRYEAANGLAQDIRRYLDDEPVAACPPSLGYRLSKFLRKNRTAAITTAAIVAASILAAVGQTVNVIQARRAEAVAARERERAEASERRSAENEKAARAAEQAAQRERDTAKRAQESADQEKDNALAAKEDLRETLYAAEMNLVQSAWERKQYDRAIQLLEEQPADLRGFEWHYWHRKLRPVWLRSVEAPTLASTYYGWSATRGSDRQATRWAALVGYRGERATAAGPRLLTVVDGVTGQTLLAPFDPFADQQGAGIRKVRQLAVSGDGTRLAVALVNDLATHDDRPGSISVRDSNTGAEIRRLEIPGLVRDVALSTDGSRLAVEYGPFAEARSRTGETGVSVWNTSSGESILTLPMLPWWSNGNGILWSPDGKWLARQSVLRESGSGKKTSFHERIRIVDAERGGAAVGARI